MPISPYLDGERQEAHRPPGEHNPEVMCEQALKAFREPPADQVIE